MAISTSHDRNHNTGHHNWADKWGPFQHINMQVNFGQPRQIRWSFEIIYNVSWIILNEDTYDHTCDTH